MRRKDGHAWNKANGNGHVRNGRSPGPVFRLANISKNLSIAPPVRVADNKRQYLRSKSSDQKSMTSSSASKPVRKVKASIQSCTRLVSPPPRPLDAAVNPPPPKQPTKTSSVPPNRKTHNTLPLVEQSLSTQVNFVTAPSVSTPGMTTRGGGGISTSSQKKQSSSNLRGPSSRITRRSSSGSTAIRANASEMKPRVSTRSGSGSRSKIKNDDTVTLNPEEFWERQGAEQWRTFDQTDLEFLRSLQEEQYPGYQHFISDDFRDMVSTPLFRTVVPPPVETVKTVSKPSTFAYELAAKGSDDEIFWKNINAVSHDKISSAVENTDAADNETSTPLNDKCQLENKSEGTRYRKYKDVLELVNRNQSSFKQNIYTFPNPLPSLPCGSPSIDEDSGSLCKVSEKCDNKIVHESATSFDSSIMQSRVLGKRGRLYDEIWDEEDFLKRKLCLLEKCNDFDSLVPFRPKTILNWNQILNNFSDDHDGTYVDWLLDKVHENCKRRKDNAIYNLVNEENTQRFKKSPSHGLLSLYSPPVPVSCHHPAAWGLHNRRPGTPQSTMIRDPSMGLGLGRRKRSSNCLKNIENNGGNNPCFEIIPEEWHPASYSSSITLPISYTSSPPNKIKPTLPTDTLQVNPLVRVGDVDELSIHLDLLINELAVQSASNFVTLSNLVSAVGNEINLQSVRKKYKLFQDATIKVSDFFAKNDKEVRNATAAATLNHQKSGKNMRKDEICSEEACDTGTTISDYNEDSKVSIFASGGRELKDQTSLPCRIFSGKCTWNYGKPLDGVASNNIECQRRDWCSLQIGDLVEVYCSGSDGVGGMWSLGVVIGTKTDSKDCVRFVELQAAESYQADTHWVCLDDGLIAQPGTNVAAFIVDAVRRSMQSKGIGADSVLE